MFVSLTEKFACVTKATKNLQNMLGYSIEEIADKNVKILMPASMAEKHDFFLQNFIKNSGIT